MLVSRMCKQPISKWNTNEIQILCKGLLGVRFWSVRRYP